MPRMQPHLNMDVFAFKHLANNFGVVPRQLRVKVVQLTGRTTAWMSRWKLGSMVRINGLQPTYIWGILGL